jgi:hypothetical protein
MQVAETFTFEDENGQSLSKVARLGAILSFFRYCHFIYFIVF